MARLPDLVRDSQLDTEFRNGYTVHKIFESNAFSRRRAIPREEYWMVGRHVGGGGCGSIWLERCVHGTPNGTVRAVKKIALGRQGLKDVTYIRELEAAAKFSQPKYVNWFVQCFGWYECSGSLCIAMEYCELGDLQGYLSSNPPLPERESQEIMFQILEGIRYMHEHAFAHRDLKPANILVKAIPPEPWWVKITDFGISKRIEESLGVPSTMRGTPHFIAPEIYSSIANSTGNAPVFLNPYAADMWALGEIAFQMLTKQPSFKDPFQLFLHAQNPQINPFPVSLLMQHNVSASGQAFISSLMPVSPERRLTVVQALDHEWVEQCKLSCPSPTSATSNSTNAGLNVPVISTTDSLNEQFATWNSSLGSTSETQTSIPPFFADEQNRTLKTDIQFAFRNQQTGRQRIARPIRVK
ncbi:kinase-like protein [Lepidopterella palustris CBS 459.81]|uniref:Kinase-like protein n=1 Tax=Lepidopterella palustris CBS 459.81 TaxID=1314670 RepID=A0A8E2E880_9PEZI|nr:kinase-like protein [Lepidopterella palustris CBS 459.81]